MSATIISNFALSVVVMFSSIAEVIAKFSQLTPQERAKRYEVLFT